ncbi:MAG: outer membrane beta-barrel domain-containing protein [Pseudomonadota bacterium]
MESRFLILLLSLSLGLSFVSNASAQDEEDNFEDQAIVDPDVDRRKVKTPKIDSENFEIGAYTGFMSVEDFGVNPVVGARFAYHITEGFFVEASYGTTDTEETSFERLSGAAVLLTDEEREFTYYNIALGYNVLPGEAFIGKRRAHNSALYFLAGAGNTEFAGDDRFTVNYGFGYRFLATDWLAIHVDVRDHVFDIDILGEEKSAHNFETKLGLTIFF